MKPNSNWQHKTLEELETQDWGKEVNYRIGEIALLGKPDLVHYSDGVKVIAWDKVAVESQSKRWK